MEGYLESNGPILTPTSNGQALESRFCKNKKRKLFKVKRDGENYLGFKGPILINMDPVSTIVRQVLKGRFCKKKKSCLK